MFQAFCLPFFSTQKYQKQVLYLMSPFPPKKNKVRKLGNSRTLHVHSPTKIPKKWNVVLPPKKIPSLKLTYLPKKRRFLLNSYWKPHHFQGRRMLVSGSVNSHLQAWHSRHATHATHARHTGKAAHATHATHTCRESLRWLGGLVVSKHWT